MKKGKNKKDHAEAKYSEAMPIDDIAWDDEEDDAEENSLPSLVKDSTPAVEEKSFTSGYQSIVKFQDPQGFFADLPKEFSKYAENIPTEKLETFVKSTDDIAKIWLTILAILLLEKNYPDQKGEWAMIVKKAKSFIKKNTSGGLTIDEFKTLLD